MGSTISWHMEKHKKDTVNMMQRHNEREGESKHSNKNIDPTKTRNNIHLKSCDVTYQKKIDKELKERYRGKQTVRKNQVHLITQTVQLGGYVNELSEDKQVEVLKNVSDWLVDRFGDDNVLSSTIHLDETNPHLHFDIIPLLEDGRLSAKEMFNRANLREIQDTLLKHVQSEFPSYTFDRADKVGRGFDNGKSQKDFERLMDTQRDTQAKLEDATRRMEQAQKERDKAEEEVLVYKGTVKSLKGEIEGYKAIINKDVKPISIPLVGTDFYKGDDIASLGARMIWDANSRIREADEEREKEYKEREKKLRLQMQEERDKGIQVEKNKMMSKYKSIQAQCLEFLEKYRKPTKENLYEIVKQDTFEKVPDNINDLGNEIINEMYNIANSKGLGNVVKDLYDGARNKIIERRNKKNLKVIEKRQRDIDEKVRRMTETIDRDNDFEF